MTKPERKKWRIEREPDWLFVVEDGVGEIARLTTHSERSEAYAARIVAMNNAGGEPVAWTAQGRTTGEAYITRSAETAARWRVDGCVVEPLYAAPPAPEPSAVEWRVSEDEARQLAASYPEVPGLDDLVAAYLDARAALTRRTGPTPVHLFGSTDDAMSRLVTGARFPPRRPRTGGGAS